MASWWPTVGEMSLITGTGLGLVLAMWSTTQRRRKFLRAAIRPVGQLRWFLLCFTSMSSYLTLATALGLAAVHDLMPATLVWFLLGAGTLAFMSACLFVTAETPRPNVTSAATMQDPPADPPVLPIRRSA